MSLPRVLELLAGLAAHPLDVRHARSEAGDVRETVSTFEDQRTAVAWRDQLPADGRRCELRRSIASAGGTST